MLFLFVYSTSRLSQVCRCCFHFDITDLSACELFFKIIFKTFFNLCSLLLSDKEVVKTEEKDQFEEVASRLTEIADEVPFIRPEIESDHKGEFWVRIQLRVPL